MDVEYTDVNRIKEGALKYYNCDLEIGGKNDFEINMNIKNDCMVEGSLWYVNDTEYGGIVDKIRIDTEKETVTYCGRSWRGILQKKIIRPEKGQDYYTVSGDANNILRKVITDIDLIDLFSVPGHKTGIDIVYQFDRYCDAYSGLTKMLLKNNLKLQIRMINDVLTIEAVHILDLSEKYEYSDDYGMKVILENDSSGINHLICLGRGELAQRTVVDLYVDAEGNIGDKQVFFHEKEIAKTFDYSNSTTEEELKEKGIENLEKNKSKNTISATFQKLDVDVGDLVGGKNRLTGRTVKETVTKEIVKIKNGIETITYKVGEK